MGNATADPCHAGAALVPEYLRQEGSLQQTPVAPQGPIKQQWLKAYKSAPPP